MGEDVTPWIFEYITDSEEEDAEDNEESSEESEKDWHILREESQHSIEKFWEPQKTYISVASK